MMSSFERILLHVVLHPCACFATYWPALITETRKTTKDHKRSLKTCLLCVSVLAVCVLTVSHACRCANCGPPMCASTCSTSDCSGCCKCCVYFEARVGKRGFNALSAYALGVEAKRGYEDFPSESYNSVPSIRGTLDNKRGRQNDLSSIGGTQSNPGYSSTSVLGGKTKRRTQLTHLPRRDGYSGQINVQKYSGDISAAENTGQVGEGYGTGQINEYPWQVGDYAGQVGTNQLPRQGQADAGAYANHIPHGNAVEQYAEKRELQGAGQYQNALQYTSKNALVDSVLHADPELLGKLNSYLQSLFTEWREKK